MLNRTVEIAPSILSADFSCLGEQIRAVERGGAGVLHVDVMDRALCPEYHGRLAGGQITFRFYSTADRRALDDYRSRHLRETVCECGAQMVSVHVEADAHLASHVDVDSRCRSAGGHCVESGDTGGRHRGGIQFADYVLVCLSIPGFGGQKFISQSIGKVKRLRRLIEERQLNVRIEIDGGIDRNNIETVVAAGAEIIVAGSAIFGTPDAEAAVKELRNATIQWV
jgi:ribulose-phosphate 3-epimerase